MEGIGKQEMEIREYIRNEVCDWDDEVAVRVRFKDFSGQRSDWEPILCFWVDLILRVCGHFEIMVFTPRQLKTEWFNRGGLSPVCLDGVLCAMVEQGHLVRLRDMSLNQGNLSRLFTKLMRMTRTRAIEDDEEGVVVMPVLNHTAIRTLNRVSTAFGLVTMTAFRELCGGGGAGHTPDLLLSHLSSQRKALTLSTHQFQGVKLSLSDAPLSPVSDLDRHILHLISTIQMLNQRLSLIHTRSLNSKNSALALLNSGNKSAALRHMKAFKLANQSRQKCENLLNRVEQVLSVIEDAQSTNKVSEAIQIGAKAIKDNKISVEEVEHSLQELEESIDVQKQLENALESTALYTSVENEDIEDELKKLELEIEREDRRRPTAVASETEPALESVDSLCDSISNLKVVDSLPSSSAGHHMPAKQTKNLEIEAA